MNAALLVHEQHAARGRQLPYLHEAALFLRRVHGEIQIEAMTGMTGRDDDEDVACERFIERRVEAGGELAGGENEGRQHCATGHPLLQSTNPEKRRFSIVTLVSPLVSASGAMQFIVPSSKVSVPCSGTEASRSMSTQQ